MVQFRIIIGMNIAILSCRQSAPGMAQDGLMDEAEEAGE